MRSWCRCKPRQYLLVRNLLKLTIKTAVKRQFDPSGVFIDNG